MEKSRNQIYGSIEQELISLNHTKQNLIEQLNRYFATDEENSNSVGMNDRYENHTDALLTLLKDICLNSNMPKYTELVDNFEQLLTYIDNHEEKLILEQKKERFHPQKEDSFLLRVQKFRKQILLKSQWLGIRFTNLFRKSKRPLKYWKHKVREKDLAHYVYHFKFHKLFLPHFREFLHRRHKLLLQLNALDNAYEKVILNRHKYTGKDEFDVQDCQRVLEDMTLQLKLRITDLEKGLKSEFKQSRNIAGTVELPTSRFKSPRINRKIKKVFARYQRLLQNHHIASQAVMEYWLFEAGIRASVLDMDKVVQEAVETFRRRMDTNLMPELTTIISGINKASDLIQNNTNKTANYDGLSKQISTTITTIQQMIVRSAKGDLVAVFESFFPSMMQSLHRVPVNSKFSGGVFRVKTIKKKYSLKPVNGRQILEGILVNSVQDIVIDESKKLQQRITLLLNDLEEILEVIEVSYDYYGPKGNSFPDEDRKELSDSLRRATIKAEAFKTDLQELVSSTNTLFLKMNQKFRQEIMISLEPGELIKTDRKIKLKNLWRLSRKCTAYGVRQIISITPRSLRWLKKSFTTNKNRYFNLQSLLGISEQKEVLSSDISNYLAETEKAIARLPHMYQRLFLIKPLIDQRFYVKREKAYSDLKTAFANWKDQKFAPACLVGEQGSGVTTLLNFIEKELDEKYHIVRINLNTRYLTESDFDALLKKLFPEEVYGNIDELIGIINAKGPHAIIILENIQHLFIRRMHGFDNLIRLFHLISQTNPGIFWLCTCLQYSWKYLDNTHRISDYFAHMIYLENPSIDTLREAILKRHRPSGFEMVFLPSEDDKKNWLFLRKRKTIPQSILQTDFFNSLTEYTKGNLSFAFLLWLRSVVKVEENVLYFKFKKLNIGFLRSLEVKKITSIYSILVHSGLTCDEHAEIFEISHNESFIQLMVMTDDGILRRNGEKYIINPLLYMHIAGHLESSNFIH